MRPRPAAPIAFRFAGAASGSWRFSPPLIVSSIYSDESGTMPRQRENPWSADNLRLGCSLQFGS
jgi:hypothetical protein